MTLEIIGKLIEKGDIIQVKETFKKREFVLELMEEINGSPYTNYAKMQLVQTKCEILDRFALGDMLKVNFNIKGNRYEKDGKTSYFSNLDAWRLEKVDANAASNNGGNNYSAGSNGGGYNNNFGANQSNNNSSNWNNNNNNNFQGNNPQMANQQTASSETPDDLPF